VGSTFSGIEYRETGKKKYEGEFKEGLLHGKGNFLVVLKLQRILIFSILVSLDKALHLMKTK